MYSEGNVWSDVPTLLAAAHELKTPLVLIRQLALELEDKGESVIAERIRLTSQRSLYLVEGLTRAARLEDALFECEPINLALLYDDVADELTPLARALGQTIELALPRSGRVMAVGNRTLLRSVMMGLCDNALTHNEPSQPVVIGAVRRGGQVVASVRDYGPATSSLATIRQHLGAGPQPLSARPRSSGLGLLIAERFARHMNGELSLRRHRDAGATFSLRLPASQQLSLWGI